MESKNKIKVLFLEKNYDLICEFPHPMVAEVLGFKDALRLAYRLLYNSKWEEKLQLYAIDLILAVKTKFIDEWEKDWRNDAFLGSAYDAVLGDDRNYDEKFYAYSRAFEKANPPPPELMIQFASCCDAPGLPPVTYEQAIELLQKAFEMEPCVEAAGLLSLFYSSIGEFEKSDHWSKMREDLEVQNKRAKPVWPSFVREGAFN